MTQEEKAKAYDEALKKIQPLYEQAKKDDNPIWSTYEYLFPQLRESEDERMMLEFNDWLCEEIECRTNDLRDEKDRRTLNMLCFVLTKVKGWLEKQKKQKPSETPSASIIYTEQGEVLAEQKPAWSEEDEKMFCNLIGIMEGKTGVIPGGWKKYVDWMKNRYKYAFPMPHWKPSEEHLSALLAIFNDPNNIDSQTCQLALTDLYEQLKKL